MTSLTVLCPNAHRVKIATTPGKLLHEVFEEACLRQGYDQNGHGLQFQRKFLDLSLPIRLCGLPNNATLDLVKREVFVNTSAKIQVALQGSFGRHMQEFQTTTTLANILETFSPVVGIDLLCKNEEELTVPVIGYMNKTWKGIDVLAKNTLKSIGIEDARALFRYSQTKVTPEELELMRQQSAEEEAKRLAMLEIYNQSKAENEQRQLLDQKYAEEVQQREKQRLKEQERLAAKQEQIIQQPSSSIQQSKQPPSRLAQLQNALNTVSSSLNDGTPDNLVDQIMRNDGHIKINEPLNVQPIELMPFANFKFPEQPIATVADLLAAESNTDSFNVRMPDRRAVVFERVKESSVEEAEEINDEFFELTAAEAKAMQRELSEQVRKFNQQAILPKSFIEKRNKEKKMMSYKHTIVRIRFEERFFLQAQFLSVEPVDRLFEFVAGILQPNAPEFSLTLFPNDKLERGKNIDLIDSGVAPNCTVEDAEAMSREWLAANSTFKAEVFTVAAESETQIKKRNREEAMLSADGQRPYQSPSTNSDPMPKWFKKN
ncbi:Tether containing UBX domain for GLUT4 [Aphelenchoides bicaudatus]|nr:Tether containing UBX domain for GLUT4 [Aphelenchoides bicaudatus]